MFPGMARSFEQSLVSQRVEPEVERPVWTPEAIGWATISCDGRTSADSWLRQMVIRSRAEGGRPLTHPVSGAKLTKSTVRELSFGRTPQDSWERLRKNEYFAVYSALFPDLARAHVDFLAKKNDDMLENVKASQALAVTSQHKGAAAEALMKLAPKELGAGVLLCCNDRCNQPRKLGTCPQTQRPWQTCSLECFTAQESADAMRELQRVDESPMHDGAPVPCGLFQLNNPYAGHDVNVGVRYLDVVGLVELTPDGELMRNNAVLLMEMRRELPATLREWLQESIAAQATRLAASVADGSASVSMAGGSPITEEEYPTLALPEKGQKRKMSEFAYSLHESGVSHLVTLSSKGAGRGKGRHRAKGGRKGGGGAGRGR